jgi:hypothetical protein
MEVFGFFGAVASVTQLGISGKNVHNHFAEVVRNFREAHLVLSKVIKEMEALQALAQACKMPASLPSTDSHQIRDQFLEDLNWVLDLYKPMHQKIESNNGILRRLKVAVALKLRQQEISARLNKLDQHMHSLLLLTTYGLSEAGDKNPRSRITDSPVRIHE